MDFLKKNLVFCLTLILCIGASGAGAFLAYTASVKVAKSERRMKSAKAHLDSLVYASPSPSAANVIASEDNIAKLAAEMASIRADLERGASIETSTDGVTVMAGIQQFISDHQRLVAANLDEDGEAKPITVAEDFGFGFEQYLDDAAHFESDEANIALDKQRQILSYIIDQLIASGPDSIVQVQRELLELSPEEIAKNFSIAPEISARVENAIETMAFSVTFIGYTESLRLFLNNLARPLMPIVVRSIEVERPTGSETVAAPSSSSVNLDEIFGISQAQKPVIEDNASKFTVTVEFIEIVLPEESNGEPS